MTSSTSTCCSRTGPSPGSSSSNSTSAASSLSTPASSASTWPGSTRTCVTRAGTPPPSGSCCAPAATTTSCAPASPAAPRSRAARQHLEPPNQDHDHDHDPEHPERAVPDTPRQPWTDTAAPDTSSGTPPPTRAVAIAAEPAGVPQPSDCGTWAARVAPLLDGAGVNQAAPEVVRASLIAAWLRFAIPTSLVEPAGAKILAVHVDLQQRPQQDKNPSQRARYLRVARTVRAIKISWRFSRSFSVWRR